MFGNKGRKPIAIQTLIGDGTRIEGDLRFEGGCHIDGAVNGSIADGNDPETSLSSLRGWDRRSTICVWFWPRPFARTSWFQGLWTSWSKGCSAAQPCDFLSVSWGRPIARTPGS